MARTRANLLLAALLGLFVVLALAPYLSTRMPYDQDVAAIVREDEGTILSDSRRIADGQVMYRDFFAFQTPGSYYYLGLAMKVGGRTIRCARLATLLTVGLTAALLFLLGAAQLSSRWLAAALALVYPFGLFPFWPFAFPYWHCLLFLVAALALTLWYVEEDDRRLLPVAGVTLGLAFLTIQSSGLPALAASAGFLVLRGAARPPSEWRRIARPVGREIGLLTAGFLVPCVVCYGYFAAHGVLRTMLYDNFVWPFTNYRGQYNVTVYGQNLFRVLRDFKTAGDPHLPRDANEYTYYQILALHLGVLAAAPLAVLGALTVVAAGLWDVLRGVRRAGWASASTRPSELLFGDDASLFLIALYALALVSPLFTGVTRKDTSHVAFLSLPGWILLFRLAAPARADEEIAPGRRPFGRRAIAAALAVWVISAGLLHGRRAYWASRTPGGLGFGDLAATERDVAVRQGGAFIDFLVPSGGTIVWANYGGWPTFTSHRDEAIPFTLLVPPPMHDLGQWRQAADAIEERLPPFVVSEDERRHVALLSSVSPFVKAHYVYLGELRAGSDLYALAEDSAGSGAAPFAGEFRLTLGAARGLLSLHAAGDRLDGTLALDGRPPARVIGALQPAQLVLAIIEPGRLDVLIARHPDGGHALGGEARHVNDPRSIPWSATR